MREWGWTMPVLADEKGTIIAGHGRILAAEVNGYPEAPVMIALGWSEAKKRAYMLADNKLALNAGWDEELLAAEIGDLKAADFDLDLIGFDSKELNQLLRQGSVAGEDEVPEPGEAVTKRGDVWELGAHRMLCGDATSEEDVARLGCDALLMFTDPPYGVEYDPGWRSSLDSIDRATSAFVDSKMCWNQAYALFSGDIAYIWHAGTCAEQTTQDLRQSGFEIRAQIIWRKPHFVISRGHYHCQHESCWYAVREGRNAHWAGDRTQSTIWDAANNTFQGGALKPEDDRTGHGTQKPVELARRAILNHTSETIYDPFLGSGSTLIAAETTSRRCYGLEIEPHYCDVIRARWEKFTGKTAVLHRV